MKNIIILITIRVYKLLSEYLFSLKNIFEFKLIITNDFYQELQKLTHSSTIIFIQTIYGANFSNFTDTFINNNQQHSYYFINTEQLSRTKYLTNITNINNNISILDYSLSNINLIPNKHINKYFLPYSYNNNEINKLKLFLQIPKIYDVLIMPPLSPHRQFIVVELLKKNINIKVFGGYGDIRDKEIARTKFLLNIHYDNNYTIFEHIRCNRWLYASHLVISEESSNLDNNFKQLFKNNLIISSYDNLVNTIITSVHNYNSIIKSVNINYNDIINYNKQYYSQIPFLQS
jgi:hypothetical protein